MMNRISIFTILLLILFSASIFISCGDDDDDDNNDSTGDDDDDVADDDDDDDDDDDAIPDDVEIDQAGAPDEFTVTVVFTEDLGDYGADMDNYSISFGKGSLSVEEVIYDSEKKTAALTTAKQKLGIDYTVTLTIEGVTPASEMFISADTAQFWATDFSDYSEYLLTANRMAVGDNCVIYVEQQWHATDVDTAVDEFDTNAYPIETNLFTTPPDQDGNGKITILGLDGDIYYGGYFNPVNSYTEQETMAWWGLHSNEMEIIYINVSYSQSMQWDHVIPHEFQHLLYNKIHRDSSEYWAYHDEGLAEAAILAVYGNNQGAIDAYLGDNDHQIAGGLSLVNWQYANYYNYALAYLFWTYFASQSGGVSSLSQVFDLPKGNPAEVGALAQSLTGKNFAELQLNQLIANWVQADSGEYGYNGLLSFGANSPPTVPAGTQSLDLEPYGGAYFLLADSSVPYPGAQGANILYAGMDGAETVDLTEPFYIQGGALLVFNSNQDYINFAAEHSGPDLPALDPVKSKNFFFARKPGAWMDPPPVTPDRMDLIKRWQKATKRRILTEGM